MQTLYRMLGLLLMPVTWLSSWYRRRRQLENESIADAHEDARLHRAYWGD